MVSLKRKNLIPAAIGLALAFAVASTPAIANHSNAMFNAHKRVTLVGTIKSFEWKNPHGLIWLQVDTIDGKLMDQPELWTIEMHPPHKLAREGWTKQTLRPGDKISIEVNPTWSASRTAFVRNLAQVNGKSFQSANAGQ